MPEATSTAWRPNLGAWPDGTGAMVRIWASSATTAAIRDAGSISPDVVLSKEAQGYFAGPVPWLHVGARYWLVLDGTRVMPDPASRSQPDGVHGPSQLIDPQAFAWQASSWRGRPMHELSIYELHVGTFTHEGTFAAAAARLEALADLGVTAVELMPVTAFPGRRNWGYDPAAQYAPADAYGAPDDLRRFVDRAHQLGLSVLLDVVYNHFGPDGAYAPGCSPLFFSDRHRSPWGAGINLDGAGSAEVRRFFIENALHWLIDYRFDGLRLDATHALIDDSSEHFLAELARTVRATIAERDIVLVAEDNRNLGEVLAPPASGGWGYHGVWSDDFHHIVRRLVAGDAEGYYRDYAGATGELERALRDGWLYRGEHSQHAGEPRGSDPSGLPLPAFVTCVQNHDQVGNRALGDRLHHTIDAAVYRALTALLLLAPETPLLFMGQEWAASTPFQYFTDHTGDLGRQVSEGRREEFKHFQAFAEATTRHAIPDPQDPATFERSRLNWDERDQPPHARVRTLHREALRLRATLDPAAASGSIGAAEIAAIDAGAVFMRRRQRDGGALLVIVRLSGAGPARVPVGLHASLDAAPLTRVLDTEAPEMAADPRPIGLVVDAEHVSVVFTRPGAVALRLSPPGDPAVP